MEFVIIHQSTFNINAPSFFSLLRILFDKLFLLYIDLDSVMTAFLRDDAATGKFRFLLSGALAIKDKSLCSALGQMKDTKVSKVSSMNTSTHFLQDTSQCQLQNALLDH